jgi:hypothetical protein
MSETGEAKARGARRLAIAQTADEPASHLPLCSMEAA